MIVWYCLAVAIVSFVLAWAYFTAQRLNRLHIRVDRSLASLAAALDRRAVLAQALVPATVELAARIQSIELEPGNFDERAQLERELAGMLKGIEEPLLIDATARVELAHRFYNDSVTTTRTLRLRPMVRLFHLGGTARLPEYFELRHA